jgi:hypothetical protein
MEKLSLVKQAHLYFNTIDVDTVIMGGKLFVHVLATTNNGYEWKYLQLSMVEVKYAALQYRHMLVDTK